MIQVKPELEIEKQLISQLVTGESQWTYRDDLKTEEQLWENFFEKLAQNNVALLADHPLTEQEKRQIKNQLNFVSYYDAPSGWSEKMALPRLRFREKMLVWGLSVYLLFGETISQLASLVMRLSTKSERDKINPQDQDRRLDVTLLINGLPMIQIELKSPRVAFLDAFHQIKKYDRRKVPWHLL